MGLEAVLFKDDFMKFSYSVTAMFCAANEFRLTFLLSKTQCSGLEIVTVYIGDIFPISTSHSHFFITPRIRLCSAPFIMKCLWLFKLLWRDDETLVCDNSYESSWAVLSCSDVHPAVNANSNFWSVDDTLVCNYSLVSYWEELTLYRLLWCHPSMQRSPNEISSTTFMWSCLLWYESGSFYLRAFRRRTKFKCSFAWPFKWNLFSSTWWNLELIGTWGMWKPSACGEYMKHVFISEMKFLIIIIIIIIIIHSLYSATLLSGALQNSNINMKSIKYNGIKLVKINEKKSTIALRDGF